MKHTILGIILWIGSSFYAKAQINEKINDFSLEDIKNKTTFSLSQYASEKVVALIFVNTYCPYNKSYYERIEEMVQSYQSKGVKFVLVNPENEQDSPEALDKNAARFDLPYLWDKGQALTQKLKATKTPEVFVLAKIVDGFIIKYHGAIDDNPQLASEVKTSYLKDAIDSILASKNVAVNYQKPSGCMIKN